MKTTQYLLSSQVNAKRLRSSVEQVSRVVSNKNRINELNKSVPTRITYHL